MHDMDYMYPCRDFIARVIDLLNQATETVCVSLPAYFLQGWESFQTAPQRNVGPGEKVEREATSLFLVETVPSFVAGTASVTSVIGIVVGFIAGLGIILAFGYAQRKRSSERRMKVCFKPSS